MNGLSPVHTGLFLMQLCTYVRGNVVAFKVLKSRKTYRRIDRPNRPSKQIYEKKILVSKSVLSSIQLNCVNCLQRCNKSSKIIMAKRRWSCWIIYVRFLKQLTQRMRWINNNSDDNKTLVKQTDIIDEIFKKYFIETLKWISNYWI